MMGTLASLRTVLVLVLALSFAGCSNSLLGPTPPGDTGGNEEPVETPTEPVNSPEILVIEEAQPVRYTRISAEPVDSEPVESKALHVSAVIDGATGGELRCGRFLLSVPAGAFDGEGTVSMTMPDSTVMVVDIEISPAELNGFKVPVKLFLLTDGTTLDEKDLQIYWWDPDQTDWKGLGCTKDLSGDTEVTGTTEGLRTLLSHFSRYSGGKAGW